MDHVLGANTALPNLQISLLGEIADLRGVVNQIKEKVTNVYPKGDNIETSPTAAHTLVNVRNEILDIKADCVDILEALSLL